MALQHRSIVRERRCRWALLPRRNGRAGRLSFRRAVLASSALSGVSSRWIRRVRRIRFNSQEVGALAERVVSMRNLSAHATNGRNSS